MYYRRICAPVSPAYIFLSHYAAKGASPPLQIRDFTQKVYH